MSRTTLCVLTAAVLATLSAGLMIGRYHILGDQVKVPLGPGTWKVTLLVHGETTGSEARLSTALPLEMGQQRVLKENCRSREFLPKPPDVKHPQRHQVWWAQRAGVSAGSFRAVYEFYCAVAARPSSPESSRIGRAAYRPPGPGDQLQTESLIETHDVAISDLARRLTAGVDNRRDQLEAFFHFVDQEIGNEPSVPGPASSALECLQTGAGDAAAKSRLLAALCRNRGIPARLVSGLALRHGHEQAGHTWVEAWVQNHWVPACPVYHHFGHVPGSFVIFTFGDTPLVRGRMVKGLRHAFLVEKAAREETDSDDPLAPVRHVLNRLSLFALPPAEQRLVEFLLLLPIAALIVCIYRNLIGLGSFGTFAPALVGLAFRELGGLPGIGVFVTIVLIGWLMRRVLDRYHLLQVPRMAFLLSLVVLLLIGSIVLANTQDLPATKYISLFPMVILTGMIERFWMLEIEDGTVASFRTLLATLFIAASISLVLSLHAIVHHLLRFPETLGLVMAAQLLIGRYTGYRLLELFRFREFIEPVISH
jgi:7 transmembrane helices usually fused to an inactive transglutaminase/Transglutaminase-like superfamily